MTLHQITTAIRALNGEVTLCGPVAFGFVVRAVVNGQPCRIICLSSGKGARRIPPECGSQTHIVTDEPSLQAWLSAITSPRLPNALGLPVA